MNIKISIGYSRTSPLYEGIELSFIAGEITNIIGENGTGKSTFYKTLIGQIAPIQGRVPDEIRENIAIVSDYISMPQELLVKDILNFIGNSKVNKMKNKYKTLCNMIYPLADQKIKTLSTGQKRMLEIFTVLSSDKSILILDEACNGLDFKNREFFLTNIHQLVSESDITIFHTSHNLEDVIELGGKVLLLDKQAKTVHRYYGNMSLDELSSFVKSSLKEEAHNGQFI